jgi:hypothetical protein
VIPQKRLVQQYEHPSPDDPLFDENDDALDGADDALYLEAGILLDDPLMYEEQDDD